MKKEEREFLMGIVEELLQIIHRLVEIIDEKT